MGSDSCSVFTTYVTSCVHPCCVTKPQFPHPESGHRQQPSFVFLLQLPLLLFPFLVPTCILSLASRHAVSPTTQCSRSTIPVSSRPLLFTLPPVLQDLPPACPPLGNCLNPPWSPGLFCIPFLCAHPSQYLPYRACAFLSPYLADCFSG